MNTQRTPTIVWILLIMMFCIIVGGGLFLASESGIVQISSDGSSVGAEVTDPRAVMTMQALETLAAQLEANSTPGPGGKNGLDGAEQLAPTQTPLPEGANTPTPGPTPTPEKLIYRFDGDMQYLQQALDESEETYESSIVIGGEAETCVADKLSIDVHFRILGKQLAIPGSESALTLAQCATIQTGWPLSNIKIDWNNVKFGDKIKVIEFIHPKLGNTIEIWGPQAIVPIAVNGSPCVSGISFGPNSTQYAYTAQPSAFAYAWAKALNNNAYDETQIQNLSDKVYAQIVSENNIQVSQAEAVSSFENGVLSQDLISLMQSALSAHVMDPEKIALEMTQVETVEEMTTIAQKYEGFWANTTITTNVENNPSPPVWCQDGTLVLLNN